MSSSRRTGVALATILVVAALLRFWGITFGLPLWSNYYVRPDESLIVEPALRLGRDPRFFNYPALMSHLVGVIVAIYHGLARVVASDVPVSVTAHAARDFSPFFVLGRLVSACAGTLMVLPVFATARALAGVPAGLTAAGLTALAPLAVREAHYAVTDTLLTLSMAVVFNRLVVLRDAERRPGALTLLGACTGLMVSAKYTGVFVAPAILSGVLLTARRTRWLRDAAHVAAVAGAVFLAVNPYLLLNRHAAIEAAKLLFYGSFQRQGPFGEWTPAQGLLNIWQPLTHGPALWLGLPLAVIGMLWISRTAAWRAGVIGAVTLLAFCAPLVPAHVVPHRYLLPMTPIVAIFAAAAVTLARGRALRTVLAVCVGSAVIVGTVRTARHDLLLTQDDTRTLAGHWIQAHVPADCPISLWSAPETEPQLRETAASIDRRIEYVHRLYGPGAGAIVDRPYRLSRTEAAREPSNRHNVFRLTAPPSSATCVAVVVAGYPGYAEVESERAQAIGASTGPLVAQARFSPFAESVAEAPIEPFDAFFLPFEDLGKVVRPGSVVEISFFSASMP